MAKETSVEAAAAVVKTEQDEEEGSEWVCDGNGTYTRPSNTQARLFVTDRSKWQYDPSNLPDWLSLGAQEHQKAFNKAYGADVKSYGSRLNNGQTPEQALEAVKSMQDTAIKFHAAASKSSKENTEEAYETMRQILKRARDGHQAVEPEHIKKGQKDKP